MDFKINWKSGPKKIAYVQTFLWTCHSSHLLRFVSPEIENSFLVSDHFLSGVYKLPYCAHFGAGIVFSLIIEWEKFWSKAALLWSYEQKFFSYGEEQWQFFYPKFTVLVWREISMILPIAFIQWQGLRSYVDFNGKCY